MKIVDGAYSLYHRHNILKNRHMWNCTMHMQRL